MRKTNHLIYDIEMDEKQYKPLMDRILLPWEMG